MAAPLIALEEHFTCGAVLEDPRYSEQFKHLSGIRDKLTDLGPVRLQEMDAGKVTLQIISHAPCQPDTPFCRAANDQLAVAVKANPKRFKGFAVLPMDNPPAAAEELERCVKELGFVGALVDNHYDGKHYDGAGYAALWAKFVELDVPVYLHPTWPSDDMAPRYAGNFNLGAEKSLGTSGFGWHQDIGLHVLKLFAAGVFDAYPTLIVIIGHFGEMLPFMMERVCQLSKRWGTFKRSFKQVYDENIFITTSGTWGVAPMACIVRNTRIENVLYSVDYPFADNRDGLTFMRELEESGLVTKEQYEMIAYKNAERLFKMKLEL